MRILVTTLLLASWAAAANQTQIVDGNYLRYEGAEYENTFFPCANSEVWSIKGGNAYNALVDFYRNSQTTRHGEIRASLELVVSPIDKTEFPDSHFDAIAEVTAIISISEDENEVRSCRGN